MWSIFTEITKWIIKEENNKLEESVNEQGFKNICNIYDVNEETKSLNTHQILKLIHEPIDSKQYSSFIHFIRKDIDSDNSVDNDSQNDSNQSDSFGFSSRLKGESLHICRLNTLNSMQQSLIFQQENWAISFKVAVSLINKIKKMSNEQIMICPKEAI